MLRPFDCKWSVVGRLITVLILTCSVGYAQSPVFRAFSPLRKNVVIRTNAIYQDSVGFMWFATDKGLFKFDGTGWETFINTDTSFVLSTNVTTIAKSENATTWVGFDDGKIATLHENSFTLFETEEGSATQSISKILFDKNDNLWYGTRGEGIYYVINDRTYVLDEEEGLPDLYIYDMFSDDTGKIWVGTDGGIAIITPQKNPSIETITYDDGLRDNIVHKLVPDGDGNVWIGTEGSGLQKYNKSTKKISQPIGDEDWVFGSIDDMVLKGNELWIGTARKGIIIFNTKDSTYKVYNKSQGLPTSGVTNIAKDLEGNLWLGTKNGIFQTPGGNVEFIQPLELSNDQNVLSLDIDSQDNIWFITYDGLFKRSISIKGKVKTEQLLNDPKFSKMSFISLYIDHKDQVWIGTYGNGIIKYNTVSGIAEQLSEKLPNGNVLNIQGDDNYLYLATLGGGVILDLSLPTYPIKYYNKDSGLNTNYVYEVFADSDGTIWFATDGEGVSIIKDGQITSLHTEQKIPSDVIYGFAEDKNGHIWINTKEDGLYKYDGVSFENINIEDGLRDTNITGVISDKDGNIVISNDLGIDIYNVDTEIITYIGESFGIKTQHINLNALNNDNNGDIYLGTDEGIIKLSSFNVKQLSKPKSHIDQFKTFASDYNYSSSEDISLKYDENNLTINYIGFWYQDPKNVKYRYKLDNYESDWITSKNRQVTYSSLPPGEYLFRLQTSNIDDFNNASEASIEFSITPPFWKTTPFYLAVIILLAGATYLFIKDRERKLVADKKVLEDKVEQRTLEIQKQKDEIASKSENITRSINYAKRIQNAILPISEQIDSIFPEHFILYKPRDIVSGDFYWMHHHNGMMYLACIDCTGHGVPGAFMSLIGYSLLNEIVAAFPAISPAEILTKLDEGVIKALKQQDEDEGKLKSYDGMDLSMCSWNSKQNKLTFSGAKRPIYVVKNNSSELIEYKGNKLSIGGKKSIRQESLSFTNQEIDISEGDKVYLFSDGYPDQFGGPDNRKFMTKKLKDLILSTAHFSSDDQMKQLDEAFEEWKAGEHQTDDVLVVGLFF